MVFFIGIKGTGMAALACILNDLGMEVCGSDLEKHFFTEDPLIQRHIEIFPFNPANIKEDMTVVIGNAFKEDFPEVIAARNNPHVTCYRYHEYLGELMNRYITCCVAGSHGKTTTTGMLAAMMNHIVPSGFLIGDGTGEITKESQYLAVEACEYRRHFLAYHPDYAIITNADLDHVDYFKSEEDYAKAYEEFACQVKKGLVLFGDDPKVRALRLPEGLNYYYYGIDEGNDFRAIHIEETSVDMAFDVEFRGKVIGRFCLPFVGRHLLWNSLSVIALGVLEGFNPKEIEFGLASFKGTKRRFTIEVHDDNVFIDDYAHHPTEVSITLDAARKRYPDRKLIAIFKPHRVSRVFHFADEFATALKKADLVYLCDFTSIDDKEDGIDIDIRYLQKRIEGSKILSEDEVGAKELAMQGPAVYLFMSSKDIYGLSALVKRYQIS